MIIDWNEINDCNDCKEYKEWQPEENVYMPEIDYCNKHNPYKGINNERI